MYILRKDLGLPGDDEISAVNLKCDTRLIGSIREEPGIFLGWHINKAPWLTVVLDGTAADEKVLFLVDMSHELTSKGSGSFLCHSLFIIHKGFLSEKSNFKRFSKLIDS